MVVPVPPALLDIFIVFNLAVAITVLLVSMRVHRPVEFSIFPALLLVLTIFRLALNIGSTRLVLTSGYAGKVINAFGNMVIGGSLVVGLVVFLILVAIQFMVITNGSGRVAEVAARFTLDAMPGKQMAIDADLNTGLISEKEARERRAEITNAADFYGAMDGASKFVKGDTIASMLITLINLFGGFAVGVLQQGMSIGEAINTYSLLTVGDGLVSQIPALLLSTSSGIIVTRTSATHDLGSAMLTQFARQRTSLRIAGGALCLLALMPGLPILPFAIVGGMVLAAAGNKPDQETIEEELISLEGADEEPDPDSPEAIADSVKVDPLELQVSFDLIDLVDPSRGGDLLDRVRSLRRKIATELGVVIPLVRTRDNLDLKQNSYAIRVNGVETAKGEAPSGHVLVIGDDINTLPGAPAKDPVFGLDARWVPVSMKDQAEMLGNTVIDRASVITTHLAEVVRKHAADLLGRQDVQMLVELVRKTNPVVIDEITPALLSLGEIQAVLQGLLREGVGICDLVRIFESVSEKARLTKDTEALVEAARHALGPAISAPCSLDGRLPVLMLDPLVEHQLLQSLRQSDEGSVLAVDPHFAEQVVVEIARHIDMALHAGESPVLLCSPQIRPALRRMTHDTAPTMPVLSYAELGEQLNVETLGVVNIVDTATV